MKSRDLDRDTSPDWDMPTTMWSRDDAPPAPARPALEADPRAITLPDIQVGELPVLPSVEAPISVEIPVFEEPVVFESTHSKSPAPVAPAASARPTPTENPFRSRARDKVVPAAFLAGVTIVIIVLMAVTPGVRSAGHGKIVAEVPATSVGTDTAMDGRRAERREGASAASTPLVQVVTESKAAATAKPKSRAASPGSPGSPGRRGPRERTFEEQVLDAQSAVDQAKLETALR